MTMPLQGTATAGNQPPVVGTAAASASARPGTATLPADSGGAIGAAGSPPPGRPGGAIAPDTTEMRRFGDLTFDDLTFDSPLDPPIAPGTAYFTLLLVQPL